MPEKKIVGRRTYLIDKRFQISFMMRFAAMVALGVLLSFLVIMGYFHFAYGGSDLAMKLFYLAAHPGARIQEITLMAVLLPPLAVAALLSVIFTIFIGLFYSHRMAGPLYSIKRSLRQLRAGKRITAVRVREHDEFQDLATEITKTIQWMTARRGRKR